MANSARIRRVIEFAEKIEGDIARRKLQPGDRYLSTVEITRMLRVDSTTANRALQLLVKRNVLVRRQRSGTFLSDRTDTNGEPRLHRVHLLASRLMPRSEGLLDTGLLLGLQGELPDSRIQFDFVPPVDEMDYLDRAIAEALRTPHPEGFILLSSTLTMQRMISGSGLPAVVFGHPYRSIKGLCYVDRDCMQIGRLAVEFLLRDGRQRVVALMRESLRPGDHEVLDGMHQALQANGVPAEGVTIRCLPSDPDEVKAEIRHLLACGDELPGILVRPAPMFDAVVEAIESLGLTPHKDVPILVPDFYRPSTVVPEFPILRPTYEFEEQGAILGRLLAQLASRHAPPPDPVLVPVTIQTPEADAPST